MKNIFLIKENRQGLSDDEYNEVVSIIHYDKAYSLAIDAQDAIKLLCIDRTKAFSKYGNNYNIHDYNLVQSNQVAIKTQDFKEPELYPLFEVIAVPLITRL